MAGQNSKAPRESGGGREDKMDKANLTREQAIAMVGLANVEAAEADNCEPTGRVGGNGIMHNDPYIEWAGSAEVDYAGLTADQVYNLPIGGCTIRAIYHESNEAEQAAIDAASSVWDIMDIEIDHYAID